VVWSPAAQHEAGVWGKKRKSSKIQHTPWATIEYTQRYSRFQSFILLECGPVIGQIQNDADNWLWNVIPTFEKKHYLPLTTTTNSMVWVRERTIPTER
jgi:hypothetical protein